MRCIDPPVHSRAFGHGHPPHGPEPRPSLFAASDGDLSAGGAESLPVTICGPANGLTGPVTWLTAAVCFALLLTTKIDKLWMMLGAALVSLTVSSIGLAAYL
jgi:hypothetical protein